MPVIDNRGNPLDADHPFASPCIVFGMKRPDSSKTSSPATNARIGHLCSGGEESPIRPQGEDTGNMVA